MWPSSCIAAAASSKKKMQALKSLSHTHRWPNVSVIAAVILGVCSSFSPSAVLPLHRAVPFAVSSLNNYHCSFPSSSLLFCGHIRVLLEVIVRRFDCPFVPLVGLLLLLFLLLPSSFFFFFFFFLPSFFFCFLLFSSALVLILPFCSPLITVCSLFLLLFLVSITHTHTHTHTLSLSLSRATEEGAND